MAAHLFAATFVALQRLPFDLAPGGPTGQSPQSMPAQVSANVADPGRDCPEIPHNQSRLEARLPQIQYTGRKEMSADVAKQGLLRVGFAGVLAPWRHAARDVLRWLQLWGERERQRRELSMLSDRDFAALSVPKMLAAEEVRKWPWQKWHPQWEELEAQRRAVVRRLRSH
jgi:hypothetical protein